MASADRQIKRQLRRADALRSRNQFQDAAEIYQSILQTAPDHPETLFQFGAMANMAGQHGLAADLIGRAMPQAGDRETDYLIELAPALAMAGRMEEALGAFRRLVQARPDDPMAHYNMGNMLNSLGKPEDAADSFQMAVALAPEFPEAHANLGAALHMAKRYGESASAYRGALALIGDNADLHHNLGAVCHAQKKFADAADAYRRAVELAPDRLEFKQKLAATLQDLQAYDEAIAVFRDVLEGQPTSVDATKGLAESMIGSGRPGDAIALCDTYLEMTGYNSAVINCKAMALTELGENAAGQRLMGLHRFIQPIDIEPPPEYPDLAAFNEAIEAEIRAHESLDFEPLGLATASGFQTGELLDNPSHAIGQLATMINSAVRSYMETLPDDPGHPFIANAPKQWTFNGWGVILQEHGHQRAHIHPSGWLSGVYYVRVPDSIGEASKDGWIEFGTPPENIGCKAEHEAMQIRPQSGRMLLFPSYAYHHTIPYRDIENRISFAFDVVPVRK